MTRKIQRSPGMQLEVWVKDRGEFDVFRVFMDGVQVALSIESEKHVEIPAGVSTVLVQFEGEDGGISVVVDPSIPKVLERQNESDGTSHAYEIIEGP